MAEKFDRDRFAYELAQELGFERAKWARGPEDRHAVSEGLQRTAQRGAEDLEAPSVEDGAMAGLSTVNRARRMPPPGLTSEANPDAADPVASAGRANRKG